MCAKCVRSSGKQMRFWGGWICPPDRPPVIWGGAHSQMVTNPNKRPSTRMDDWGSAWPGFKVLICLSVPIICHTSYMVPYPYRDWILELHRGGRLGHLQSKQIHCECFSSIASGQACCDRQRHKLYVYVCSLSLQKDTHCLQMHRHDKNESTEKPERTHTDTDASTNNRSPIVLMYCVLEPPGCPLMDAALRAYNGCLLVLWVGCLPVPGLVQFRYPGMILSRQFDKPQIIIQNICRVWCPWNSLNR